MGYGYFFIKLYLIIVDRLNFLKKLYKWSSEIQNIKMYSLFLLVSLVMISFIPLKFKSSLDLLILVYWLCC